MGAAPYRVIEDIENYNKLGGMKKQLYDTAMQVQMMNVFSARQNDSINVLMKLQYYGIKENQILNLCRIVEANGIGSINLNAR